MSLNLHLTCFNTEASFLAECSTQHVTLQQKFPILGYQGRERETRYTTQYCLANLSKLVKKILRFNCEKKMLNISCTKNLLSIEQAKIISRTWYHLNTLLFNTVTLKSVNTICRLKKKVYFVLKSNFFCVNYKNLIVKKTDITQSLTIISQYYQSTLLLKWVYVPFFIPLQRQLGMNCQDKKDNAENTKYYSAF